MEEAEAVAADVDAEDEGNMNTNCQLCHKRTHIELGKACKVCRMILEDSGKEFCSKACRNIYLSGRRKN